MKKSILDIDVYEKRVLLRVDFNVPMENGKITSNKRIVESLPTINYLLGRKAKLIVCSHLGRPDGEFNKKYSLKPVFDELKKLLPNVNMSFCEDVVGEKAQKMASELNRGELLLLENLRFMKGEEENSEEMVNALASLADIFVLDAFGTSHRKHASTYGVAKKLPSVMGFLVQKEVETFDRILTNPDRPFVAILGGAKVTDKIDVVKNLISKVDTILIGGGMCFTFLKAIKGEVGSSLVDSEKIDFCYDIIKEAINKKVKIILPVDFVCAKSITEQTDVEIYKLGKIPADQMGLDIGPKTVKLFKKFIKRARTIVWNGPMGVYEKELFQNGTKSVAELIAKNKKCVSVAGGGDVVSAVEKFELDEYFTHISTGGGASLKLLEGKELPAISVLQDKESE
jgi:phosphoglycerate kinase